MAIPYRTQAFQLHNPCLIKSKQGTCYYGQITRGVGHIIEFKALRHGLRAVFSIFRYWHLRYKYETVSQYVDAIDWLDPAQMFAMKSKVYAISRLDPNQPFDYRRPEALTLVSALAKAISDYDLLDSDIQEAQKMIL